MTTVQLSQQKPQRQAAKDHSKQQTVAVIGSGMAGLTAARLMQDAGYAVTIYEALKGRGMDSHSLAVDGGIIDAPLRVMNASLWKNTLSLAAYVGVPTFAVRTYMSCNWLEQNVMQEQAHEHQYNQQHTQQTNQPDSKEYRLTTWFKSQRSRVGNLPTAASFRFLNKQNLKLLKGYVQLKYALKKFKTHPHQNMSLAQFHAQYSFDPLFWYGTVLPVIHTICTCKPVQIANWPAKPLLQFVEKLLEGDPLLRLQGGTPALVDALTKDIQIRSGSKVALLEYQAEQVLVQNEHGEQTFYDYAIVATPTTQLNFLNSEQFDAELKILQLFEFDQGELVIHRDSRFMPKLKQDWTVLNYAMDKVFSQSMFTIWINAIEPTLVTKPPVFQTWNPLFEPQADHVVSRVTLSRAIVNSETAKLVAQIKQLQQNPERRVFFCGSWLCDGLPILESAVTSAMWVAKQLGVDAPFIGLPPIQVAANGLPH